MKKFLLVAAAALFAAVFYLLQPVCAPLSEEDLKSFNVPIEQRTDRDIYLKVFQKKNGQWHQCKTRLSRYLFF
jgi:hypothetical protein